MTTEIDTPVAVWFFRTNLEDHDRLALGSLLSEEELAAAERFRFAADRLRSVVSHARLRLVLANCAAVDPSALRFGASDYGKPFVAAPVEAAGLSFNLAHSGDFCAIAVTRLAPVGIDMEWMRTETPFADLPVGECAPPEAAWIYSLPESERVAGFYRVWTRKEAVLKAQGSGLSIAPREINALPSEVAVLGKSYFVADLQAPAGYSAALALEGRPAEVQACRDELAAAGLFA